MIYQDFTAIEAVNNGQDTPDAFYNKTELIATSKWHATDGWRGYKKVTAEPGYKVIYSDWVTGNYSDAGDNSENATRLKLEALESKHKNIFVVFTPTSNVFSTSYNVIVRDKKTKYNAGEPVGHKTRRFETPNGWKIRYHATDVISYSNKSKKYKLDTGGWHTRTTAKRMNEYLPNGYRVYSKNYQLRIETPTGDFEITDGMEV